MRPPVVAEALVAAVAPPNDYESIAGDLHEEYLRYARLSSKRAANRWYWSQVLLSIPSLLSYSRAHRSALHAIGVGLTVIAVLIAMLLATVPIDALLQAIFGSLARCPLWVSFCAYWIDAVVFGTVLALIVRGGGVRACVLGCVASGSCLRRPCATWFPIISSSASGVDFVGRNGSRDVCRCGPLPSGH